MKRCNGRRARFEDARKLGAEDLAQNASGNLGWAYYQLGDDDRALAQFVEAQANSARLGDFGSELNWLLTAGYVYRDNDDVDRATESCQKALALAKQIDSKGDIINALEDLAEISVESGRARGSRLLHRAANSDGDCERGPS